MKVTFVFLVFAAWFSLVPAWLVGALISLIDLDAGIIIGAALFAWLFIDTIYARIEKSIP